MFCVKDILCSLCTRLYEDCKQLNISIWNLGIFRIVFLKKKKKAQQIKANLKHPANNKNKTLPKTNLYFCSEDYCYFLPVDSGFSLIEIL